MKAKKGISYETQIIVYLDGKKVGKILTIHSDIANIGMKKPLGYCYKPNGSKPGSVFFTLDALKKSLEGE